MKRPPRLPPARLAVLVSAAVLFPVWLAANFRLLTGTQNGLLRFGLSAVFSLLILLRPKPVAPAAPAPAGLVVAGALAGLAGAVAGIVFGVHQVEWLGLVLLLLACLLWALPPRCARDAVWSLVILYWAHPLPERVFEALQLALQTASVRGSEWLLQLWNTRVWADGFVLRTGYRDYGVPEWCSGMRTATAVGLLAVGLGVLRRLRVGELAGLVGLGLVQSLALNVLRIAAMVVCVTRQSPEAEIAFLHNTAGVLVIAALFLLYVEIGLWDRRQAARRARREGLPPGLVPVITETPPFWRFALKWKWAGAGAVAAVLLVAGVAHRSRPAHRLDMIRDVVAALRDNGKLEEAERAARVIEQACPNDGEWALTITRILVMRGKHAEAMVELDRLAQGAGTPDAQTDILRAYALTGLGRVQDAAAIVEKLPDAVKHRNPRVAIILAEWGYHANDPDRVAEYVVPAARWAPNLPRVRALYPYLRAHRQWQAIAGSDAKDPHPNPAEAFAAMEAYMNLNQPVQVARLALAAAAAWPSDHRVLEPLFFLAARREPGEFEERYAAHLRRTLLATQDMDRLYRLFEQCFELARPDLAWSVYRRMAALDPSHPALGMGVVRQGRRWFAFRRRYVGMNAPTAEERTDIKGVYRSVCRQPRWQALCDWIPLGAELSRPDTLATRQRELSRALAEFARRDAADALSLDFQYEYVQALEIAGRVDEAREQLGRIAGRHPDRSAGNRVLLSELYERQGDWQGVYETLRDYLATTAQPQPAPAVRLGHAALELRLGIAALRAGREAVRRFPESGQAAGVLAAALADFDSREEALLALGRRRPWRQRDQDLLEAESLYLTARYSEAAAFCRAALLVPRDELRRRPQRLALPPAEMALMWHRIAIPSRRDFARNAQTLEANLKTATSPFLRGLMSLWLECYDAGCAGRTADLERWAACGRDPVEKALALNQLTLLLCWQDRPADARRAAEMAAGLLPDSPLLWRPLIGLTGGDADVIRAARRGCPEDSEIWLAELVARTRPADAGGAPAGDAAPRAPRADETEVVNAVREAIGRGCLTPAALTRAGEYLSRIGMPRAAAVAARDAVEHARGLLPAYVLGVRCALEARDRSWALACTKQAIEASANPPAFFYQKLVQLKLTEEPLAPDDDVVEALKNLWQCEPDNPVWAQALGYLSFRRGGAERVRALYEMTAAAAAGVTNKAPYIIGAEAARYLGNWERAVDLLQQGLRQHPRDLTMLNNLAYTLAGQAGTAAEALPLVSDLMERGAENLDVLDTVATVYLANGQLVRAEDMAGKIVAAAKAGSPHWFRARLVQARIAMGRQKTDQARRILDDALNGCTDISDEDLSAAGSLMGELGVRPGARRQPPSKP